MSQSQTQRRTALETTLLLASYALFVAMAVVIAVQLPRGRGNDEDGHTTHIRHVADTGSIQSYQDIDFGDNRETHQPPVYYVGGAGWLHAARALGLSIDSVRLYSLALGMITFWLVWAISARLLPIGVRVLPNLVMASWPMVAQQFATISNDTGAIFFSVAMLYAVVRVWQDRRPTRWYLIAGICGGLAVASKVFAAPVVVVFGLALVVRAWRTKQIPAWLLGVIIGAAPFMWWLVFNYQQTGLWYPQGQLQEHPIIAAYKDPPELGTWYAFAVVFWQTLIGRLGSWDIVLPLWLYGAHGVVGVIAAIGLFFWRRLPLSREAVRFWALSIVGYILSLASLIYLNLEFFQPQARYTFPGIVGLLWLFGLGSVAAVLVLQKNKRAWMWPAFVYVGLGVTGLIATVYAL